jgi:iron complex transport system substrate-binding protein
MIVSANRAIHAPRRIACLQPSATVILDSIGMLDRVVACTKWCRDVCPAIAEDRIILADSWTAQAHEIVAAKPDLVIASVPYQLEALAEILKAGVRVLAFAPRTLADIYGDIAVIAGIMGVPERGEEVVSGMEREIEAARKRSAAREHPLVFCEEWGKPIIHSQPWVAELIEAAGGRFLGEPGKQTTAIAVRAADPDVMIFCWCGAGDRVPVQKMVRERGWTETRAARSGRVYCISDELLNTPAPTLIRGLHAIEKAVSSS